MPLIHMAARGATPDGLDRLRPLLLANPPGAPVTILLHGFKFSPFLEKAVDPRTHIFALRRQSCDAKAVSWPRHLGYRTGRAEEGICIGFAWHATGGLRHAYREAATAGRALATLIRFIHSEMGVRPNLFAHSLGARVALCALRSLEEPLVQTVILQAAAEFQSAASRSLDTPAGRGAQIVNVNGRENDLFDLLFELGVRPAGKLTLTPDYALGEGLPGSPANWVDLQLDHPEVAARLKFMGFPIAPAKRRVCHWSLYLRPGAFALYRALIRGQLEASSLPIRQPNSRWARVGGPFMVSNKLDPSTDQATQAGPGQNAIPG